MTTIENKMTLKYRIKDLLNQLPKYERLQLQDKILSEMGCSYNMFFKMIHIEQNSSNDIKGGQLKIFAKHLGCTVDDLYSTFVD